MIVEKDKKVVGKVKFEKGSLSLAFPKDHVQQLNIQEQLENFKENGIIEFVISDYIFLMKKDGDAYTVSLTKPKTKTVTISDKDASKIEQMLMELSEHCIGNALSESHSSTNLL